MSVFCWVSGGELRGSGKVEEVADVPPAEERDAEGGHDQADPVGRKDADTPLPQVATGAIRFGAAGDQEPTDPEESEDSDLPDGRPAADPVLPEQSKIDGMTGHDHDRHDQAHQIEAVVAGVERVDDHSFGGNGPFVAARRLGETVGHHCVPSITESCSSAPPICANNVLITADLDCGTRQTRINTTIEAIAEIVDALCT